MAHRDRQRFAKPDTYSDHNRKERFPGSTKDRGNPNAQCERRQPKTAFEEYPPFRRIDAMDDPSCGRIDMIKPGMQRSLWHILAPSFNLRAKMPDRVRD